MPEIIGYDGSLVLIEQAENSVVVDTDLNVIVDSGLTAAMKKKRKWSSKKTCTVGEVVMELANGALSSLDIKVITASGRLYTIPASVQDEAKKALEWRKEEKRGGTPVGLNTARTLARGGQIGIEKIRHIAKYFPRHEVDKKAKGYEPGEPNFPSNGRIAWALWGGDAGWRWAKNIVERENKKALTADGYALNDYYVEPHIYEVEDNYDAIMDDFKRAIEIENGSEDVDAPEFLVRVRMDGSGMDRLYKVDVDGQVYVWDDGCWDTLGHIGGDVYTYDKALDDPYDLVDKDYFTIDPGSAVVISAMLQQNPHSPVSVFDLDNHEAMLAEQAADDIDLTMVDYSMVAALAQAPAPGAKPEGDGAYTSEERAKNAAEQPRDGGGLFAKEGTSVTVKGGQPGTITAIDKAAGTATVQSADGTSAVVPIKDTKRAEQVKGQIAQPSPQTPAEPLDTSGILGEPRTPMGRQGAQLPGTLPALTPQDLGKVMADWPAWVADARQQTVAPINTTPNDLLGKSTDARTPFNRVKASDIENNPKIKQLEKLTGIKLGLDAYKHPLLKSFLGKKNSKGQTPNAIWYQPVTSSGEDKQPVAVSSTDPDVAVTPETSDVPPLFLALVSPDDPRAVMDVVAVVPAGTKSTEPVAFTREDKKWVKNPQILNDLRSATPPPVVPLDTDALTSVMAQTDGVEVETVTASAYTPDLVLMVLFGPNPSSIRAAAAKSEDELDALYAGARPPSAHNIDKNKGNAEKLRRYWVRGKGAAKIRWGEGGDWKRCVRYLSKYLGLRAKGYCQLRHKEATGMYTSTHAKLERGKNNQVTDFIMEEVLTKNYGKPTIVTDEDMLMELEDIHAEQDDLYEAGFTPEPEIEELLQDEGCKSAMTAAGGADRNNGRAEALRRYWTVGKGGVKIRWNTPGDWTRCVRQLSKYLGTRAKGYCALRHHEMTGQWTGEQRNRRMDASVRSFDDVLAVAELNARALRNMERLGVVASAGVQGAKFCIPLIIPEGVESGDGRSFQKGSITNRELPLPLLWQIKTADGHKGSVVVGRIDRMERLDDGIGNAYGVFDTGAYGREAERLVRNGFIRGVSADMDQFEAKEQKAEKDSEKETLESEDDKIGTNPIIVSKARIMAVTIVPKPAFQECKIVIIDDEENNNNNQEDSMVPDGIYVDEVDALDAEALVACGFTAGAIPMNPPKSWFENPKLNKPTPLTVDDDGRVYGHIAAWHVDHIGMAFGTRPPRSKSNYAYFHTGVCRSEEGADIPVGQLTLAGGHASIEANAAEAVKHYDDTASSFADVHAGEDAHGIWVSGALRPGTTPEQIRAIRASAPSGDWRPIRGSLELVAVCQVNVPGFPIARARVASGQVMALVAAGAATLAKMKTDPISELTARVNKLEQFGAPVDLSAKVSELATRVNSEAYFEVINHDTRMKLASKGHAMPDGSYPIRNAADLKNAIHAYGRAPVGKEKAVKDLIIKRAKDLRKPDLIPDEWQSPTAKDSLRASASELQARVAAARDSLGKAFAAEPVTDGEEKFTFETQPRDSKGKFRQVLAVLKDNLGAAGLENEYNLAKKVEMLNRAGHYVASARAASELLDTVSRMETGALNRDSLENIQMAAGQLGTAVANSPLPFGHDTKKMRFSDLPAPLQKLTKDMMERVEKRIGKKEADQATAGLQTYLSGGRLMTQSNISAELSKMLRLLT
jgi:hypothetical protein